MSVTKRLSQGNYYALQTDLGYIARYFQTNKQKRSHYLFAHYHNSGWSDWMKGYLGVIVLHEPGTGRYSPCWVDTSLESRLRAALSWGPLRKEQH